MTVKAIYKLTKNPSCLRALVANFKKGFCALPTHPPQIPQGGRPTHMNLQEKENSSWLGGLVANLDFNFFNN